MTEFATRGDQIETEVHWGPFREWLFSNKSYREPATPGTLPSIML